MGRVISTKGGDKMNVEDFPKPHIPNKLPLMEINEFLVQDADTLKNIIQNGRKLSEFIGYLQNLPDPSILITSLTLQESVLSSRIEGTLATIKDVVNENITSENIKNDIREIENYFEAVNYGYRMLRDTNRGISKSLIKELHVILLENNVRGANKTPGAFKTEQNFILNKELGNFTPLPPILTDEYIDNLVEYLNKYDEVSELLQAAIMHVQFELIHPFKDGNGRVGRLLIPLFLFQKKVIPFPIFYISRYFAENNDNYKMCLFNISQADTPDKKILAWNEWIKFFFNGISIESQKHIEVSKSIIELYKEMSSNVSKTEMIPLITLLFEELKISPKKAAEKLNISSGSVHRELKKLAEKGYVTRSGSERKTIYIFTKILELVN